MAKAVKGFFVSAIKFTTTDTNKVKSGGIVAITKMKLLNHSIVEAFQPPWAILLMRGKNQWYIDVQSVVQITASMVRIARNTQITPNTNKNFGYLDINLYKFQQLTTNSHKC